MKKLQTLIVSEWKENTCFAGRIDVEFHFSDGTRLEIEGITKLQAIAFIEVFPTFDKKFQSSCLCNNAYFWSF